MTTVVTSTSRPEPARVRRAALAGLVAQVARRVALAPAPAGDPVAAVCALLTADPRNHDHVAANVTVIVFDALDDPFRETDANRWRGLRPPWLRACTVGATVNRLRGIGVLVPTGRYVRCTDTAARNSGKFHPIYALDLAALGDHQADALAAA